MTDTDSGETSTTTGFNLTVTQAVDRLCVDCAADWEDAVYARAGQRQANHRAQQLALELRHAEEGQYLDEQELHGLSVEADRGERLAGIRTAIATEAAITACSVIRGCSRCRDLVDVLFPGMVVEQVDFGGEE